MDTIDSERYEAMAFLMEHPLGKERKEKREAGKPVTMPIQHYLSTWEIAKIMVEYKNRANSLNEQK
jgi:hypothetical protein